MCFDSSKGPSKSTWYDVLKGSIRKSPSVMLLLGGFNDFCTVHGCSFGHKFPGWGFLVKFDELQGSLFGVGFAPVLVRVNMKLSSAGSWHSIWHGIGVFL